MELKNRLGGAIAGGVLFIAVVVTLTGTLFPGRLQALTAGIETAVPGLVITGGLAVVLAVAAVGYLRAPVTTRQQPTPLAGDGIPPEEPQQPPARVGEAFDTAVAETARDVRVRQLDPHETEPRARLRQTAIDVVAIAGGCSRQAARTRLDTGRWSTDPIACAFLSNDIEYPLRFRVFRWARPELAYERALSRTTTAIAAVAEEVPGSTNQEEAGPPVASGLKGILRRLTGAKPGDEGNTEPSEQVSSLPAGVESVTEQTTPEPTTDE